VLDRRPAGRVERVDPRPAAPAWSNEGVPWCVHCNKFLTPSTVRPDATCPKCGEIVERGLIPGMTRPADEEQVGVPWHLKLLGIATALYLGFRFWQLIDWLLHR
jgi:hypothetical protein